MPVGFAQLKYPADHPKFVNLLPNPAVIDVTAGGNYVMKVGPAVQWLGLVDENNNPLQTNVWGYGLSNNTPTYPGPTFLAMKDVPVHVKWENHLPDNHLLPIDMSVHVAHPATWFGQGVPIVTHLHGGHTEAESDGHPDAWYTSNYDYKGHEFVKKVYTYDNDQEAATLWYHDHALGITRLNVYAGMAGFYLLRDANELSLGLPSGNYERGIVFQDRNFTAEGQLTRDAHGGGHGGGVSQEDCQNAAGPDPLDPAEPVLPNPPITPLPETSIAAEFFGDYILVNAMTWPYLDVEQRQYRLRLLNGSDSRFYYLVFKDAEGNPVPFLQIGTDDGLLPFPVEVDSLLMGPGERADILINFAGLAGVKSPVTLFNYGPDAPFADLGDLDFDETRPTAQLMQFNVVLPLDPDAPVTNFTTGSSLRPAIAPLNSNDIRKVVLFEGRDQYCRLRPQLGILDESSPLNGSLMWDEPITENPALDAVEYWDIYNTTADAHPMHLHLVSFQILGRTAFDGAVTFDPAGDPIAGGTKQILALNSALPEFPAGWDPPADNEKGWKDTGISPPGTVTRVAAKFDREGKYVWHCHILSHEDHEMMRQLYVGDIPEPTIRFSGRIRFSNNTSLGVGNATVSLTGSATGSAVTDVDGDYQIHTTVHTGSFTLKPSKTVNKLNGVTVADATAVQQHVTLFNPITDPYKQAGADVNKSNSITTVDASVINQSLLGNPQALAQFKTSWRFVPTNHTMATPPWGFPEQRTYTNITEHHQANQDFYGIKTGDVVTTFANPANFGGAGALVLTMKDDILEAGREIAADVQANQVEDLAAFQLALGFNPAALQLISAEPLSGLPMSTDHFGLYNQSNGEVRVVWSQTAGLDVAEAAPLFRLRWRALQSGSKLSEVVQLIQDDLPALAYNSRLEEAGVQLRIDGQQSTSAHDPAANNAFRILQTRPNPFSTVTVVGFVLPEAGEITLRVIDGAGREVRRISKHGAAGYNEEVLHFGEDLPAGILHCEIATPYGVAVKKLVRL